MKNCRKCGIEFIPTKNQLEKYDWICLECKRAWFRSYTKKGRDNGTLKVTKMPAEWVTNYQKKYYQRPEVKEKRRKDAEKRRLDPKNKQKYYARMLVSMAIKSGKLKKENCFICSSTERIDAHHEDYFKPLDIVWLCRKCHRKHHAQIKGE